MNAAAFRRLYEYHFSENHRIWESYIVPLSYDKYTQELAYSRGSVRNQLLHLANTDEAWFCGLREVDPPETMRPVDFDGRELLRARWDNVERNMRLYLAGLRDDMLLTKPWSDGEDKDLVLWEVLIHVVNHGTDHRAQILRLLNDLGLETGPQDYVFYAYAHPLPGEAQAT